MELKPREYIFNYNATISIKYSFECHNVELFIWEIVTYIYGLSQFFYFPLSFQIFQCSSMNQRSPVISIKHNFAQIHMTIEYHLYIHIYTECEYHTWGIYCFVLILGFWLNRRIRMSK